eukprot:TRINITY_DN49361_c0_g2_i1.p1 TRINITY_DN49361_c0_g2~~TRINITY_DN49361_c0_g2_i1.p1  ORF type:complete len:294 (+),score=19.67 TRINITY_DN49361_c0_g2_i1:48-884(+)
MEARRQSAEIKKGLIDMKLNEIGQEKSRWENLLRQKHEELQHNAPPPPPMHPVPMGMPHPIHHPHPHMPHPVGPDRCSPYSRGSRGTSEGYGPTPTRTRGQSPHRHPPHGGVPPHHIMEPAPRGPPGYHTHHVHHEERVGSPPRRTSPMSPTLGESCSSHSRTPTDMLHSAAGYLHHGLEKSMPPHSVRHPPPPHHGMPPSHLPPHPQHTTPSPQQPRPPDGGPMLAPGGPGPPLHGHQGATRTTTTDDLVHVRGHGPSPSQEPPCPPRSLRHPPPMA